MIDVDVDELGVTLPFKTAEDAVTEVAALLTTLGPLEPVVEKLAVGE